jgi:hypothetical protein
MLFISTGVFDDKLRPQILSVGTTANAALSCKLDSAYGEVVSIKLKVVRELRQVGGFLWVLWVSSTN